MLKILYGVQPEENSRSILRQICENRRRGVARQILIVPEQASFDAEWKLCQAGGDSISAYAEVLSFTRLASRVFSTTGGVAARMLDKSGRLIAMAGALEQVRSRLKIYGRFIAKPEFLLQLLDIVDEFKSYGVNAGLLNSVYPHLSGQLAQKMEELRLILESYEAVCANAALDPADRLDRLVQALTESDFARERQIYIDGFSDFTAQERAVIVSLMQQAEDVTVSLCCDDPGGGQSVFAVTRQTAAELLRDAAQYQVSAQCLNIQPGETTRPAMRRLQERLFAPGEATEAAEDDAVSLYAAQDAYDECMHVVAAIQRRVLAGSRWREIGVACADAQYLPILENLLARYEIPAYFAGNQDILSQGVIRMVLAALEAAACGMEPEAVAEYLKSGYAPLSRELCDRLENYACVWNIRGAAWERPFTADPQGYDRKPTPQSRQALEELNQARTAAVVPLLELKKQLLAAKNTGQQVLALYDFLERIQLEERLRQTARQLNLSGNLQRAQTCAQLYNLLIQTMEQIYGVLGNTVRTADEFRQFLSAALSRQSVGTIPAALDCVHVGDLSAMRYGAVRHRMVLGASEGLLPRAGVTGGLLSEQERKILKAEGLPMAPDAGQRLDRELLCAYQVLTSGTQTLEVTCRQGEESYLFTRIAALFDGCVKTGTVQALPVNVRQAARLAAAAPEEERQSLLKRMPELTMPTQTLQHQAAYQMGVLGGKTVEKLYGREIYLSASRIDKFAACKLAFFLQYGLQAKERRQASVDAPIFGTFVHYVLENTARQAEQEGGFRALPWQRVEAIARQYMERFTEETLDGLRQLPQRTAYLFRRSLGEVLDVVKELYGELCQSEFTPVGYEMFFGDGGQAAPIVIQGQKAVCKVSGYVDRVDLYHGTDGDYVRVVDYKTGRKDFDYTDILSGMGLQMLVYLFALEKNGKQLFGEPVRPAGVLYFPARLDVLSQSGRITPQQAEQERRKALRRKGLLLDDERVLQAMEPCQDKPQYLPYQYAKDGTRKGDLATCTQIQRLEDFVYSSIAHMGDEILDGKVAPNPYSRGPEQTPCRYCAFYSVCHVRSGGAPVRNLAKTDAEEFWRILEQGGKS